jgi:hypothetical protein
MGGIKHIKANIYKVKIKKVVVEKFVDHAELESPRNNNDESLHV